MDQAKLEERLVRLERGLEQSLELLGRGRSDEAQLLLSQLLGGVGPSAEPGVVDALSADLAAPSPAAGPDGEISDDELDRALAGAEPERDRMRDADEVAQQAMLQADRALEAEGGVAPDEVGEHFATETMAHLLEQQGDRAAASRIRAALGSRGTDQRASRAEVVATLERWLDNLRGGPGT